MVLNGEILKDKILEKLKNTVSVLKDKPSISVIQIGDNDASNVYINQKKKMCDYVGYKFSHIRLEENTSKENIISIINELNNDSNVNGVLLQLPIPTYFDENELLNLIDPLKDIDGLTDINIGKLVHNKNCLISCTPLGIITLLEEYKIDVTSKNIVIIGKSNLVGKPLANLLINKSATVTICNSKTKDLKSITKNADILISATGKINLITEDMVKENSIIIDVGITRDSNNKLHGDVDYDNVKEKVSLITPVPGGIGPMTIAALATNILKAYQIQKKK